MEKEVRGRNILPGSQFLSRSEITPRMGVKIKVSLSGVHLAYSSGPQTFAHQGPVPWRQFFHRTERGNFLHPADGSLLVFRGMLWPGAGHGPGFGDPWFTG